MMEIGKMIYEKEKEFVIMIMEDMKEIGKMTKKKEKEYFIGIMGINLKEIGKMI